MKSAIPIKRLIYFIIFVFIAGNVIFIFIKYNSDRNINNLIHGNQKLLDEFEVNNELRTLENEVALVENKVRSAIASANMSFIQGVDKQIVAADMNLRNLQKISDDDSTEYFIDELDTLVRRKLRFDDQIIGAYTTNGKQASGLIFKSNQYKTLTDSIPILTQKIENRRQKILSRVTDTIDSSVNKVQRLSSFLIAFVLISTAFVFLYIINTIRTQSRLIQKVSMSEKKAKEAATVKEHFLANMSHEIRTPMNAILGFTDLLAYKNLDAESRRYVQIIHRSVENLLTIVNDILDISKIEAGMIRLESAPFSIRGLVHSVEMMFRIKSDEKRIELLTEIDDSLPDTLEGDSIRLTQILVNLISNAIKFTEKGRITMRITNAGTIDDGVNLGIQVQDTGIGIEKEKLVHIFDRFQQVDDSTIRQYGGTGLGLSIVKDLVGLQKGSIDVVSEPGIGTSFYLVIPFKISNKELNTGVEFRPVDTDFTKIENARVLIVEDNEINQTLLKQLFLAWHLEYNVANNGQEAIEKLRENQYDLVLMDIQMPLVDGYSATQEIRKNLKSNIPIIAMTAHAMAGEKEKCLSYGMNEYIAKPVRAEQLKLLITKFINPKSGKSIPKMNRVFPRAAYRYIHLDYMKEVGAGNEEYEKDVTRQFINAIPRELSALQEAVKRNELDAVRAITHNLKTTVSVMGLNELLQPVLDKIEYGEQVEDVDQNIQQVSQICQKAVLEAQDFLLSITKQRIETL